MNKEQLRGRANAIGGEIMALAGRVVGDKKLEAKGNAQRPAGRAQEKLGDVEQATQDLSKTDE